MKGYGVMDIYAKMGGNKCVQNFGAEKSWEGNINMAHREVGCMEGIGSELFPNGRL
jgi:hypothetical protein